MTRACMSSSVRQGKMRNQIVFRFLLLYNILEIVYGVTQAADGRAQGFVQEEGELNPFVDNSIFQLSEKYIKAEDVSAVSFTNLEEENLNTYASPVSFQPSMLEFHSHPVGMPHMERVIVKNLSPDTSIHMLSISGNTLHLYCSFFQEKVIPPGGNTSFEVVFLARQEGPVENTLFIHTSLGSFKYQVTAMGTLNPYRLRPFIGVRMPLNSSYTPIIHMHNPHPSTLQLTEMYTSGGDLHLELPDGENEASKNVWEIPPYETKPVIKANFIARVEKNHTAFIRIRMNGTHHDYLVLPVEVDVTSVPGIYSPTEVLDFGILRSHDPPKVLSLSLLNSGQKHVHIVNVIVTPVNEAVDVKFIPIKVPPDTVFSTQIATVAFNPAKASHLKQCSGKIVIKSKNNQFKLHIPYHVELINGSLDYNESSTRFYVGSELKSNKLDIRELNITNNFDVTIIIYSLSLPEEAKPHFKVSIKEPVVLQPGETLSAAWLTFQPAYKDLQLTTYLRLMTNVSYFDIPLLCFSGHLKIFLPHAENESIIDFGTLGIGDKRTMIFAVINENPVDVNLKLWGSNTSRSFVELVGVDKGNVSTLVWRHNFSSMAHSLVLKPHHYAIFRVGVSASLQEGIMNGHAFVETQHEKIVVPFSLRTAKGGLRVEEVYFGNIFPGKISTINLYVHSSFSHSMTVTGVTAIPEDPRFTFDPIKHAPAILYPNARNLVGKVQFDLRKHCKQKCYSGLPTSLPMGHQWLLGMSLTADVADSDRDLFKTLHSRWKRLFELEGKSVNLTLNLDTTEVRGHLLRTSATLQWPRLFNKHHLKFQITQIGNRTVRDFTLENPSSLPLIVQVVPLSLYPKPTEVIKLLNDKLGGKLQSAMHLTTDPDVFTLDDLEENNQNPENHIPTYRKSVEEYFGVQSHKQSIAILLTPGMRVRIRVGFAPKDELFHSSLMIIRNNLTALDAFLVQGQGGHGEIKFGNISPGSDSSLNFELTDKHLKDCDGTKTSKFSSPNYTVRKPFMARNTGALPIYIQGFDISGKPCESYGFRVLNCEGFELKPNESKRIDIAFTPDFTLTRVERTLNIHTSQGPNGHTLQFILVATIPKHMLAHCSETLPRPFWEPFVYYIFNLLTSFLLCGLVFFAHFDSHKLLNSSYFPLATIGIHAEKIERGNMFDLKQLSASSDPNSAVKVIKVDVRKPKENLPLRASEISLSYSSFTSSSPSSSLSSSHKRNMNVSLPKSKDLIHLKEYEETFNDNSSKSSKRKTSKVRCAEIQSVLEPQLVEIKKSQPRNSWTRFLKPPFSFNSKSQTSSMPSVGTQTVNDEPEDTFNELDLSFEPDINNLVSCERGIKRRAKVKKEIKYIEHKIPVKKNADSIPEEETCSTTTETSTTESDISEKDHQLPDVCVTSKVQKSRFTKNKNRERNTDNDALIEKPSSPDSFVDGEGFELSTKSRGHKKIKVNPNKVFSGDILHPSTLELPYKPNPVIGEKKNEGFSSDDSRTSQNTISHVLVKNKVSSNSRKNCGKQRRKVLKFSLDKCNKSLTSCERNDGSLSIWHYSLKCNHDDPFVQMDNFHQNVWSANISTNSSAQTSSGSLSPSSYSAVLSRDISKNVEKPPSTSANNFKPVGSQRIVTTAQPAKHHSHSSSPVNSLSPICSPSSLFSTVHAPNDLSASKLKNWMVHSSSDSCTPGSTFGQLFKDNIKQGQDFADCSSSTDSLWSSQPISSAQEKDGDQSELCGKQSDIALGDWSRFSFPTAKENAWHSTVLPTESIWSPEPAINPSPVLKPSDPVLNVWNVASSIPVSWENTSKVWSPPSCDDNSLLLVGKSQAAGDSSDTHVQNQEPSSEFNPFHTLGNLWISQLNVKDGNSSSESAAPHDAWSFSLFSEPASPRISEASHAQEVKEEDRQEKALN